MYEGADFLGAIVTKNGQDVSTFITLKQLVEQFNSGHIHLPISSWLALLIISIGFPAIVAWRSTLTKYSRRTGEKKSSIYDKLK